MAKKRSDFPGYDSFLAVDTMDLSVEIPERVRPVDMKRFIKVNLTEMWLEGDAGRHNLRLREKGECFTPAAFQIFAFVILTALNGRRKISTLSRWVDKLSHFTQEISKQLAGAKLTTLTLKMLNTYERGRGASDKKLLRSVLGFWHDQNVPGIEPSLARYLQVTPSPKSRGTIEIQNSEPLERPFSASEVRAMLADLEILYAEHKFNPQDYLLWRLIISEAVRPSQLRLLRVGDVTVSRSADGRLNPVILKMPFVKQAGTAARDYMIDYQLSEPVGRATAEHLAYLRELHGPVSGDFALFCVRHNSAGRPFVHPRPVNITALITKTRSFVAAKSSDLDDIDLFTRRFKHTKLTHLAVFGASIEVLAHAGFQTSVVSLRHYVNLTEEAFSQFERQMETRHELLLRSFRGEVVSRDAATRPEPTNRICDPTMEDEVGACAERPCDVLAPYGCYVCHRFEAFEDGPHDRVEAALVAKRARAMQMNLPAESVTRDDYLLDAVRNVIAIVEARR